MDVFTLIFIFNYLKTIYFLTDSFGLDITQNPPDVVTEKASETLHCEKDAKDNLHDYMFWYRQRSYGELSLVAFSRNKDTTELVAPFKNTKYRLSRPELQTGSLEILSLEANDSAVYFCAFSMAQSHRSVPHCSNNYCTVQLEKDRKQRVKI